MAAKRASSKSGLKTFLANVAGGVMFAGSWIGVRVAIPLLLIGLFCVGGYFSIVFLEKQPDFRPLTRTFNPKDYNQQEFTYTFADISIFNNNILGQIKDQIEKNQLLKGISVQKRFPNAYSIEYHKRLPQAVVKWRGNYYFIDSEAVLLDRCTEFASDDYPVIKGIARRGPGAVGAIWRDEDLLDAVKAVNKMITICSPGNLELKQVEVGDIGGGAGKKFLRFFLDCKPIDRQIMVEWGRQGVSTEVDADTKLAHVKAGLEKILSGESNRNTILAWLPNVIVK